MDYLVEHPEVGTIKYVGNNRAKRIIISVKPEFVRVVIPKRQSLKNAQKFVESKLEWIKKNKNKIDITSLDLIYDYQDKMEEYKRWARNHYDSDRKIVRMRNLKKIVVEQDEVQKAI